MDLERYEALLPLILGIIRILVAPGSKAYYFLHKLVELFPGRLEILRRHFVQHFFICTFSADCSSHFVINGDPRLACLLF